MKKINKIILGFISCFAFGTAANAQQDPQFSQYMFNTMAVNPAYAGSRDVLNVTMLGRTQWTNVENAPRTVTLSADMPFLNEKIGVGGMVYSDNIGVVQNTGISLAYAQRIRLTRAGTLSFGANAGGTFYQANLPSAQTFQQNDVTFSQASNGFKPNLGLGAYYATDKWYMGASMPRVLNNKLAQADKGDARQYRHYFVMAGFVWHINPVVVVKPSFLGKAVAGAPLQADFNFNIWFYDKISFGGSYRTGDAAVAMVELIPAQKWRFGFAYDFTVSGLSNNLTGGAYELMIRHEFAGARSKILSPRYF